MRAKKTLGQHFLKSEKALASIIRAGEIKETDTVLEIGPGTGALTKRLLATGCQVLAVEKDNELYEFLKEKFKNEIENRKLELVHGDILEFETNKLETRSYKLIANIPYNITGAIFKKFLSGDNQPEKMVLLVQKEVAERIVTRDGKESILSISVKAYGKPKIVERVPAGAFVPAPKVDSAILLVEGISKNFFTDFPEGEFFSILRTGFASKRKKLSSNLSLLFPKEEVSQIFGKLKLDPNTRAEDVPLGIWGNLTLNLYKHS